MERVLYHGSEKIIEKPIFNYGNKNNDYGLGFYCTQDKELAKQWASRKYGIGFVNKYRIRDDRLKILDLTKGSENNVLIWISLLLENRTISKDLIQRYPKEIEYLRKTYLIDVSKYDVVIGYRADDAYFKFPESFVRSEITIDSLNRIYKAGNLGKQYVLISKRAFNLLKYELSFESSHIDKDNYYTNKKIADNKYNELIIMDRYTKGNRLIDLVRDNV